MASQIHTVRLADASGGHLLQCLALQWSCLLADFLGILTREVHTKEQARQRYQAPSVLLLESTAMRDIVNAEL